MRKIMNSVGLGLATLLAAMPVEPHHMGRTRYSTGHRPNNSIAKGNRWGGPHLNEREIARRQRQAARKQVTPA